MTKEALKLALEALECWQRNEDCNEPMSKILEAIKEALAQPEPWEKFCDSNCVWTDHHPDCKLAQPEQHQDWCASLTQMLMSMPPKPAPCNCKPKPEQEPVGPEPFGFFQYDIRLDAWVQNRINNKGVAFYTKEKK